MQHAIRADVFVVNGDWRLLNYFFVLTSTKKHQRVIKRCSPSSFKCMGLVDSIPYHDHFNMPDFHKNSSEVMGVLRGDGFTSSCFASSSDSRSGRLFREAKCHPKTFKTRCTTGTVVGNM
jgi:hypothetical protein